MGRHTLCVGLNDIAVEHVQLLYCTLTLVGESCARAPGSPLLASSTAVAFATHHNLLSQLYKIRE